MMTCKQWGSALLISLASAITLADTAVIVSASNVNASIDQSTISKIFLGKSKSFPDGSQATPIDQNDGTSTRESFNDKVLGKSASQLKSYWSRLIFTGKGTPPKQYASDTEIKAAVASNPNLIGYINSAAVDGTVKVVHKF
jgi:ABC-type phosphate transport system substrate-binding protein